MQIPFKYTRVLVMTAVQAEKDAVLRGLGNSTIFDVQLAGVGPALAAARTAKALALKDYDLVISAGIAGGYVDKAKIGSIVVATEIVAADLGAETLDGFLSLDELGFGSTRIVSDSALANKLTEALNKELITTLLGPINTVSTATGTTATALERASRVRNVAAEGMEGFGVATAAIDQGIPILEIRSISNPVGPRDRDAWRIKEALRALEAACITLREVLQS